MPKSSAKRNNKTGRKQKPAPGIIPKPPQKPAPAYIRFSNKVRPKLKEENPNLPFGALSKLVGVKWHALDTDEKKKYYSEYEKDLKKYKEQEQQLKELDDARIRQENDAFESIQLGRNMYANPEQPANNAAQWLPLIQGASGSAMDNPSLHYMGMPYHTPPFTPSPVSLQTSNLEHVNYHGYTPPSMPIDDERVVVSEPANQRQPQTGPVPTGIFISDYHHELLAASTKLTSDVGEH